ncbi:hypothetical protein RDABS01_018831 [Bienertia sinuspersici]
MASFIIFFLPLLFTTPTSAITTTSNPAIKTAQQSPQQLQFNTIIDSIVGAGDFSNWANLLSQADPSIFPLSATLFIPDNTAFRNGNLSSPSSSTVNFLDPLLFPYHIIPRRFSFFDLRQFPIGARLPTLLPGNTLLITNNSAEDFTINGAKITHSDLFQNAVVSAHGISDVLDYTLFGNDDNSNNNDYDHVSVPASSPKTSSEQDFIVGPSPLPMEFRQEERGPVVELPKSAGIPISEFLDGDVIFLMMAMCFFVLMSLCSLVALRAFMELLWNLILIVVDLKF